MIIMTLFYDTFISFYNTILLSYNTILLIYDNIHRKCKNATALKYFTINNYIVDAMAC